MQLRPNTFGIVQLGPKDENPLLVAARYYEIDDHPAFPRRQVASALRSLAANMEATADRLEGLERP
jgi:hypothetical protein